MKKLILSLLLLIAIPFVLADSISIGSGGGKELYINPDKFIETPPKICSISLVLSDTFDNAVYWDVQSIPITEQEAEGNNGAGTTEYNVTITSVGCKSDIGIKANANLGLDGGISDIPLVNEKWMYNRTDSTVPDSVKTSLTTSFVNVDSGVGSATIFFKFFLNVSAGQAAGVYNNSLSLQISQN